jgi:hypothetical protein
MMNGRASLGSYHVLKRNCRFGLAGLAIDGNPIVKSASKLRFDIVDRGAVGAARGSCGGSVIAARQKSALRNVRSLAPAPAS